MQQIISIQSQGGGASHVWDWNSTEEEEEGEEEPTIELHPTDELNWIWDQATCEPIQLRRRSPQLNCNDMNWQNWQSKPCVSQFNWGGGAHNWPEWSPATWFDERSAIYDPQSNSTEEEEEPTSDQQPPELTEDPRFSICNPKSTICNSKSTIQTNRAHINWPKWMSGECNWKWTIEQDPLEMTEDWQKKHEGKLQQTNMMTGTDTLNF